VPNIVLEVSLLTWYHIPRSSITNKPKASLHKISLHMHNIWIWSGVNGLCTEV